MEYRSAVWDPYLQKDIYCIEMVQWHAACWVKSDYNYNSSVSTMLANLLWPSLQHRHYITRLKLFHNIINSISVLKILPYFSNTSYPTCRHHPLHFEIPFSGTDNYRFNFYPRSIRNWNNLPTSTIECQSLELFLGQI